jgi:hypothetical protein
MFLKNIALSAVATLLESVAWIEDVCPMQSPESANLNRGYLNAPALSEFACEDKTQQRILMQLTLDSKEAERKTYGLFVSCDMFFTQRSFCFLVAGGDACRSLRSRGKL